ncbi:MAG: hypothetical protein QM628_15650 [Propionicimonas sp.]
MTFQIRFSGEDRAWVASLEDSPTVTWIAPTPVEALEGLMALTPIPDATVGEDEDDRDGREVYDEYIRALIRSGAARGCACDRPDCHCDGIADAGEGYLVCGCCMADCQDAHGLVGHLKVSRR